MTNNQLIEEDFEREFEKSFVYLLEAEKEVEEEYYNSLQLPARIFVNIPNKEKYDNKRISI